jgi:AhpC/TSA family
MTALDALATDGPMPEPDTRTPGPTDALGREVVSSVLEVGSLAPELSGQRLGGGDLSTRDLQGRPLVVLFWLPPKADGTPQDDTPPPDALLDELDRRGGNPRVLLVVETEIEPGDAQRYLDARGAQADVMVDRTGELFANWGLVFTQSAVLLDAEGRVIRVAGPEAFGDPAVVLDAVGPGPTPSDGAVATGRG